MKYFIRSVKYFAALCVLYWALVWLSASTSAFPITNMQYLQLMFSTWRGWMLIVATVLLAATYPRFGFVTKRVECCIDHDREQIENAFRIGGYELKSQTDDEMTFRATSPLNRLTMLFEDEIKVKQWAGWVEISGLRRTTVKIAMRLDSYITNKRRHEQKN